jgi:tetratricopeptide (TPR) repeat protein
VSVYTQVGAALFFLLSVCSGFGVQYLVWLVPWIVGVGIVPAAFFTLASGAFLFLVYNWSAGGFPWYLADLNYVGDFTPHLNYSMTLCWISVIVLAFAVWRQRPSFPSPRIRILLSAAAIAVFAYPVWNQARNIDKRTYPPASDRAALVTIRAQEDATLSQIYYKLGRYTDAVIAARTGIALDPAVLDAWNNLALACIQLQRWDEALNAANNAVRLAPDDEAANANLAELLRRR